jgi:ATP-binding cassette subfamily E protein 1
MFMNRIAVVDREKCQSAKSGFACIKTCPVNRKGETCIDKDGKFVKIDEDLCIGCGLCVKKCPFGALTVVNVPKQLDNPVHRYGENSFALFNLPVPMNDKIVGVIGANGIGKSTALRIMSGQLKPNLGQIGQNSVEWDEIIKQFRGKEIQEHLEKLADGEIKVSIKPQEIDKIPQLYSGRAGRLIKGAKPELLDDLGLRDIDDREIKTLSGGELQRLSLAVCLSKDADLYCIDEPGSFNDIRQRIAVAKAIRKNKNVIVVEHDLAMMDMIADNIHILYGSSGAYGVVSGLKSVRKGINDYLSGYIPEENVRIRPESIQFDLTPLQTERDVVVLNYPTFEKRIGDFVVNVDGGEINNKEIVAIVGANALGKTTFLKFLAESKKFSYKPQHPKSDYEGTVRELLMETAKDFSKEWYKKNIVNMLGLGKIMDKCVANLSGGEIQKLAVGICLSRDTEIIALDEPTAYVDAESRWELANVIKNIVELKNISAFIIDHDIQFIDYVSDRIILFDGVPGKHGHGSAPMEKANGMNKFLRGLDISFRRDETTKRPRINKYGSQKDQEQKKAGRYYY